MRFPGGGKYLLVGLVSQLAIFNPVIGVANVPKELFDALLAQPGTQSAFTAVGTALGALVENVLSNTGSGRQTLPTLVDRFTTKLKIAAETIIRIPAEDLANYGLTSPEQAKQAARAIMQYRGYITEIPQTPVLADFLNQPVPIPQDFWNPDDKTPETYSEDKKPLLFPMLEKLARYINARGVEYDNYRALIQWFFAARYDAVNETEDLDLEFYDQFVDGIRSLSSNVQDVLGQYVNIWFEISQKYTLGGGLDSEFYEDQRELQAYLEARMGELKAVMTGFWSTHGFLGMVRYYEPYVEPPPKEKKGKGKGKGKKGKETTW
ncbi:hypothetical protein TWF481_001396 [Arthrobotrys musiformis]|uniref:Uncharacterized protein n=1 Tax=Arthrobotrys musiformis TaxID=47236 RepID=A0AAV9WQG0_9PEZI